MRGIMKSRRRTDSLINWSKRLLNTLLSQFNHPCKECAVIQIPFWKSRCSFCGPGEGRVKS